MLSPKIEAECPTCQSSEHAASQRTPVRTSHIGSTACTHGWSGRPNGLPIKSKMADNFELMTRYAPPRAAVEFRRDPGLAKPLGLYPSPIRKSRVTHVPHSTAGIKAPGA